MGAHDCRSETGLARALPALAKLTAGRKGGAPAKVRRMAQTAARGESDGAEEFRALAEAQPGTTRAFARTLAALARAAAGAPRRTQAAHGNAARTAARGAARAQAKAFGAARPAFPRRKDRTARKDAREF